MQVAQASSAASGMFRGEQQLASGETARCRGGANPRRMKKWAVGVARGDRIRRKKRDKCFPWPSYPAYSDSKKLKTGKISLYKTFVTSELV